MKAIVPILTQKQLPKPIRTQHRIVQLKATKMTYKRTTYVIESKPKKNLEYFLQPS